MEEFNEDTELFRCVKLKCDNIVMQTSELN